MAVLERDKFFERIKEQMGDTSTDEAIAFLEDMTDTYNSLSGSGDGTDWKQKYDENDAAWRKKYTERFFSGSGNQEHNPDQELDKPLTYENLFKTE